jgi:hypothetical protein
MIEYVRLAFDCVSNNGHGHVVGLMWFISEFHYYNNGPTGGKRETHWLQRSGDRLSARQGRLHDNGKRLCRQYDIAPVTLLGWLV